MGNPEEDLMVQSSPQKDLITQMEEATPLFVDEAIKYRLPQLFPSIKVDDLQDITDIIHDDMKLQVESGDLMEKMDKYGFGPEEAILPTIQGLQRDIEVVLMELGIDVLEGFNPKTVRWT